MIIVVVVVVVVVMSQYLSVNTTGSLGTHFVGQAIHRDPPELFTPIMIGLKV